MRLGLATLTIVAAALLGPAAAGADFQSLYDDYRADGVIDGCTYSSAELGSGLSDIPADVREYDPAYAEAINSALEQVAAGCDLQPAEIETPNEISAADGSPGPAPQRQVPLQIAGAGRDVPTVLVAVIVALAALLATSAVLALGGRYGWGQERLAAARKKRGF